MLQQLFALAIVSEQMFQGWFLNTWTRTVYHIIKGITVHGQLAKVSTNEFNKVSTN